MRATLSLELAPMSGNMGSKGRVSLLDTDKTLSTMVPPTDAPTSIVLKLSKSKFQLSNSDRWEIITHFNLHFHDNRMWCICNVNMNELINLVYYSLHFVCLFVSGLRKCQLLMKKFLSCISWRHIKLSQYKTIIC